LLLKTNLQLLQSQLDMLAETPFFTPQLDQYVAEIREIPKKLLERLEATPPIDVRIARNIEAGLWVIARFLAGSTNKQIPYEVVYAVTKAAEEWFPSKKLLATTSILQEQNFYFYKLDPNFFTILQTELGMAITFTPLQIALPYMYCHRPLFCTPLFHELGHFADFESKIVETSLIQSPPTSGPDLPGLPPSAAIAVNSALLAQFQSAFVAHRREYFADLFWVMYAGAASIEFLQQFAADQPTSFSHPATNHREAVMRDFLAGNPNQIVDMFQSVLRTRGLPPLAVRGRPLGLKDVFQEVRPITPKSAEEIYSVFAEAWSFLQGVEQNPTDLWVSIPKRDRERVVNDLAERSIRNRMIMEQWDAFAD
jgi:hypothetical protein